MHINIQAANKTNIPRIVYRMNNTTNTHIKNKAITMYALRNDRQMPSTHHGKFPCHIVAPSQVVRKIITGSYKRNGVCDTEL
jgi:hypothetical protein